MSVSVTEYFSNRCHLYLQTLYFASADSVSMRLLMTVLANATSVTLSSAEAKDNVGKRVKSACNKNFNIL